MAGFADLIAAGKEFGVFQFYLPFVLSFAVIYGILAKAKIFGKEKTGKNINIIVSAILSLFLIGYTPVGITLAEYFGSLFTGTVLVVVTILGTMMILFVLGALAGVEVPTKPSKWAILLVLIAIVLAIGVFISSGGMAFFPGLVLPGVTLPSTPTVAIPSIGITTEDIAMIAMVAGMALIMLWLVWEKKEKTPSAK
jgi:hypothetical protein